MENVQSGLFVSVNYTGTLKNGDVFDSSEGREPMEIQVGQGQLIEGFESELMGMTLNETKTFTLEPEQAYGQRNEELTHTFPRSEVPPDANPEEGQTILLATQDGRQIPALIVEANDEQIVLDLNHPLAGETLTFDIEIVGISDTPTQEPQGGCGDCGCDQTGCSTGDCSGGDCH